MKITTLAALITACGAAGAVNAQPFFAELLVNPPGADDGWEAIELEGAPGFNFDGYFIVIIEGDLGASGLSGVVDQVVPLAGATAGSNGILLIRDSLTNVILPAPASGTNLLFFNFVPDIENGANTYLLGFGTPPERGADLDDDDDGTLNPGALTGFTVVDAFSYVNGDEPGVEYADDVGFPQNALGDLGTWTPDYLHRAVTAARTPVRFMACDVLGSVPGPFTIDLLENFNFEVSGFDPGTFELSFGTPNAVGTTPCPGSGSGACGPGDWNEDGVIDFNDLLAFLNDYNTQTACSDVNGDGAIDFNDLLEFLNRYNTGC
jgi:hypothetical protein